jgi:hypothetical protein
MLFRPLFVWVNLRKDEISVKDNMKIRFSFACLLALRLFQFSVVAQTSASQTDTQEWNDVQIAVPVTKEIEFNILGTIRFGRNVSRPVDERIGVGTTIRLGQYFSFAPSLLHIGMQPFAGRRVWENRLSFPLTARFKVGKFRLSDRNLFERRYRSPSVDASRYRNRFQVEHPLGPDRMKLSMFVADEVFYDWSVNDWVRNRLSIGISGPLNKNLTVDIYYLRQNDGRAVPGDLHVIGTTWRIKL